MQKPLEEMHDALNAASKGLSRIQPLTALELLINVAQLLPTLFVNNEKPSQQSSNNVTSLKRRFGNC
jgi:hypothetical protein